MAKPNVEANVKVIQEMSERSNAKKKVHKQYVEEQKVDVVLSPFYAAHFGKVMRVDINTIPVFIPVNGQRYSVPATYADEIERRRMCVDSIINKQGIMANYTENLEKKPGELVLF